MIYEENYHLKNFRIRNPHSIIILINLFFYCSFINFRNFHDILESSFYLRYIIAFMNLFFLQFYIFLFLLHFLTINIIYFQDLIVNYGEIKMYSYNFKIQISFLKLFLNLFKNSQQVFYLIKF
jgi:hypothetical protein